MSAAGGERAHGRRSTRAGWQLRRYRGHTGRERGERHQGHGRSGCGAEVAAAEAGRRGSWFRGLTTPHPAGSLCLSPISQWLPDTVQVSRVFGVDGAAAPGRKLWAQVTEEASDSTARGG